MIDHAMLDAMRAMMREEIEDTLSPVKKTSKTLRLARRT